MGSCAQAEYSKLDLSLDSPRTAEACREYSKLDLSLDSPRTAEACRRRGVEACDLKGVPEKPFHPCSLDEGQGKATSAIRREHDEIKRHRTLREVTRERQNIIRQEQRQHPGMTSRLPGGETSPRSQSRQCPSTDNNRSAFAPSDDRSDHTHTAPRGRLNPILEEETQRLDALKKRQALELRQMLTYELRSLARKERDRQRVEKASAREAAADARREEIQRGARIARLEREQIVQARAKEAERAATAKIEEQEERTRRLENEDRLRQQQADIAIQTRAEQVAQKAALLKRRIARGIRIRRALQLRNERVAAKRADEREAAAEAARRAKEAENEARRLAASAREAAARTAFGIARRQREEELDVVRANVERKAAHLEAQAASFRNRQKEIADRERVLHDEIEAEATRERREAARRKVEWDAEQRADKLEEKLLREKELAMSLEMRKERDAAQRQKHKREKEEHTRRAMERRAKAEEEKREATRKKLEEDAAKIELIQSEKERLKASRGKLTFETAKQREAFKGYLEALKGTSQGCGSFGAIAAVVEATTTREQHAGTTLLTSRTRNTKDRSTTPKTRGDQVLDGQDAHRNDSTNGEGVREEDGCDTSGGALQQPLEDRCHISRPATRAQTTRASHPPEVGEDGTWARPKHEFVAPYPPTSSSSLGTIPSSLSTGVGGGSKAERPAMDTTVAGRIGKDAGDIDVRSRQRESEAKPTIRGKGKPRRREVDRAAELCRRYGTCNLSLSGASGMGRDKLTYKKGKVGARAREGSDRSDCDEGIDEGKSDQPHGFMIIEEDGGGVRGQTAGSRESVHGLEQRRDESIEGECHAAGYTPFLGPTSTDNVRATCDREFLDALEEEQAAEEVREKTLAEAKAWAKVAQARARSSKRAHESASATTTATAAGDAELGLASISRLNSSEDPRHRSEPRSCHDGRGRTAGHHLADDARDAQGEAETAAREEKQLALQLALERKAASKRITIMSERYEEAINQLSRKSTRT